MRREKLGISHPANSPSGGEPIRIICVRTANENTDEMDFPKGFLALFNYRDIRGRNRSPKSSLKTTGLSSIIIPIFQKDDIFVIPIIDYYAKIK